MAQLTKVIAPAASPVLKLVLLTVLPLLMLGIVEGDAEARSLSRPKVIPFEYSAGFLVVDLNLDGVLPLKFIFDTGSKHTILTDNTLLPLLRREPAEKIKLVGSDLSVSLSGRLLRRTTIHIADLEIRSQSLIILDDDVLNLAELTGQKVYGILGIGAFGAYAITIDYRRQQILLGASPRPQQLRGYTSVPLTVVEGKAYIHAAASIHAEHQDSLQLLIDTGASLALLINTSRADSSIYPPRLVVGDIGLGLGGKLFGYVGRSDTLSVGSYNFTRVITHFQLLQDSIHSRVIPSRNGLIGNRILDRFHVILDMPASTLHLKQQRKLNRPHPYDRSGLKLVSDAAKGGGIRVQFVNSDSPAWQAGIRSGDQLLRVNGISAGLLGIEGIRRKLRRKVGRKITVLCTRSTVQGSVQQFFEVSFRLQELI